MKTESIIFYLVIFGLLCFITIETQSTEFAVFAFVVLIILLYGLGKNASVWLDRKEEKQNKKPL